MLIENTVWIKDPIDKKTNIAISCTINGQNVSVPLDSANTHYDEILKQVDAGTITIKDAD
tara:strand:- start:99 stop:278 length:180 start_codon:yes stop_codon:yes gene_type:complete